MKTKDMSRKPKTISKINLMPLLRTPLELFKQTAKEAQSLDGDYMFSEKARRAIFFAKYEASLRNTDEISHHITIADLLAGITREQGKVRLKNEGRNKEKS